MGILPLGNPDPTPRYSHKLPGWGSLYTVGTAVFPPHTPPQVPPRGLSHSRSRSRSPAMPPDVPLDLLGGATSLPAQPPGPPEPAGGLTLTLTLALTLTAALWPSLILPPHLRQGKTRHQNQLWTHQQNHLVLRWRPWAPTSQNCSSWGTQRSGSYAYHSNPTLP